ncbi:uncharacterized protein LOC125507557 isoform X3 [Triticum urartu]|uniref:uncharacterized protein LOC125507557 isoform X3 n=1 Tax=Triticum urartu TaxID=4572 RepID=UPI002043D5B5|nr:uncharacterized protein LOC125507557 isoform X3 [Triticum urartu]
MLLTQRASACCLGLYDLFCCCVIRLIKKATTRDCAPSCSRLFLMLQPFPVEWKGRWKKLQEEWCSQRDIENQYVKTIKGL